MIWKISYSGSPYITTDRDGGLDQLGKILDIIGSSIDMWNTGWTVCIDLGKYIVNEWVLA